MPPSYEHIIHFSLLTPPHSSKAVTKMSRTFLHKHTSMRFRVCTVRYSHVKKNYLYILNIWTQNNLLLMQSACYIMHGLSLSQHSFMPCCAFPPTAPHRQADAHTHLHLVLTDIYSTLALSPTLSVCSQTACQMSERERHRGRPRVGGVGRLKVKETERENLKS